MAHDLVESDPYRPVFACIEAAADHVTCDAYADYRRFVTGKGYDPSVYVSQAITSGGYVRDPQLAFGDALARNETHGELIATALVEQYGDLGIERSDIVVPACLGKVEGWGQADYLLFWSHVISGLPPETATLIDADVRSCGVMAEPGFTDKTLTREQKWASYKELIDTYVEAIDALTPPIYPENMQAIVLGLDPEVSLGVNAERYLGYRLGIGEYAFGLEPYCSTTNSIIAATSVGCTTLVPGEPDIVGTHNLEESLGRRAQGQFWRKSGIISGIVDRRAPQPGEIVFDDLLPASALWEDYYAK